MSEEKDMQEIRDEALAAMEKAKNKNGKVLEVSPEQAIYMIRIMRGEIADRVQEIAACHSAIALQSQYINKLLEENQLLKLQLDGKKPAKQDAEDVISAQEKVNALMHDDIRDLLLSDEERIANMQQQPIEVTPNGRA